MSVFTAFASGMLHALVRRDDGLMTTERALLAGVAAMVVIAVLFLLGVDILAWFAVEEPAG